MITELTKGMSSCHMTTFLCSPMSVVIYDFTIMLYEPQINYSCLLSAELLSPAITNSHLAILLQCPGHLMPPVCQLSIHPVLEEPLWIQDSIQPLARNTFLPPVSPHRGYRIDRLLLCLPLNTWVGFWSQQPYSLRVHEIQKLLSQDIRALSKAG